MLPINQVLYVELLSLHVRDVKSEYVFLNPRTGKPFIEVKKSYKNAGGIAGINDLRFHDLRQKFHPNSWCAFIKFCLKIIGFPIRRSLFCKVSVA